LNNIKKSINLLSKTSYKLCNYNIFTYNVDWKNKLLIYLYTGSSNDRYFS